MRTTSALSIAALICSVLGPSPARAQRAEPVPEGAVAGYELLLVTPTSVRRGHPLEVAGVGYEVEGLAELQPRAGLEIVAAVTERVGTNATRRTVTEARGQTVADGRFELSVDVPRRALNTPVLRITVGRPGTPPRVFRASLTTTGDARIDLLTDRHRYQAGETIRIWTRARDNLDGRPRPGAPVEVTLRNGGTVVATASGTTAASGVVTANIEIPESLESCSCTVSANLREGQSTAQRRIEIGNRTVERILARIELAGADEDGALVVMPGGHVRGRVIATTASGTPIRGAAISVSASGQDPVEGETDAEGVASFDVRATHMVRGRVATESVVATVRHPAFGQTRAAASVLVTRSRVLVEATARGGALVPELPVALLVAARGPRGRPLPANTEVVIRGVGIAGGETVARLDAQGIAEASVTLPRGGAGRVRRRAGCAIRNGRAATFQIEVRARFPRRVSVCVPVEVDAEVMPRVAGAAVAAQGRPLEVDLFRRASVRGRPVLVEAFVQQRRVAVAWANGRDRRVSLDLPPHLTGVVEVLARALGSERSTTPYTEEGSVAFGLGAHDAVLVRPRDAFTLSVVPESSRYLVRESANVHLRRSDTTGQAWATLLVRDEAAHGGEADWSLSWFSATLDEAVRAPGVPSNDRLLRTALGASIRLMSHGGAGRPPRPAPLEAPYWRPSSGPHFSANQAAYHRVQRDPMALRDELLRRGVRATEQALERAVTRLVTNPSTRERFTASRGGRRVFHPDAVAHLVADRALTETSSQTLGGQPITVAMLEAADPGFSFETVARRVARTQLAKLLIALMNLSDPDNPNAQRASANLPPERWLGTLVRLRMVNAADLVDPWGNPFVFRRVSGTRFAVSERALSWELASAGPDGRVGTRDDVRDPFARVVPSGTPYAVNSGEEAFLRRVGQLAPSTTVLTRMRDAYRRLSLAAREEHTRGPTTASNSEVSDEVAAPMEAEAAMDDASAGEGLGGLGVIGHGSGGGGGRGYGRGARAQAAQGLRRARVAGAPAPAPPSQQPGRVATALSTRIREDFPATLFFLGEIPLTGPNTTVEVPLADALTTYRLEAIAWTASGWTTSGEGRLRVDQQVLVDAVVPAFATVGDSLRIPTRIENRGEEPLRLQVRMTGEDGLSLAPVAPRTETVAPGEALEMIGEVALETAAEGFVVVTVSADDGTPLDAVRRPMRVFDDARTARSRFQRVVEGVDTFTVTIPEDASDRGPGALRVAVGAGVFPGREESSNPRIANFWGAWTAVMSGSPVADASMEKLLRLLGPDEDGPSSGFGVSRLDMRTALALSAAWGDDRLNDTDAARALAVVSRDLPSPESAADSDRDGANLRSAELLVALAPISSQLSRRPDLEADARALLARLAQLTANQAARLADAPLAWARAAAGLALTGQSRTRAEELIRRATRSVITLGDVAWVEAPIDELDGRLTSTALLALARIALDQRSEALPLVRGLVDLLRSRGANSTPTGPSLRAGAPLEQLFPPLVPARSHGAPLAAAAIARLIPGDVPSTVSIRVDGRSVETTRRGDVYWAPLQGVGQPGEHRIEVELPTGAIAIADVGVSYGMPWSAPPLREAPIQLVIDGELGARDTRSAAFLYVRNQGATVLTRPRVELELPAGSELDEDARRELRALLRHPPILEERTLILHLRPLPPGSWVRIPLAVRWSMGGNLRGLGAVAYDDTLPEAADTLPVSVLPSVALGLADEGPEPRRPDDIDDLPPPFPTASALTPLRRLVPGGAR